MGISFDHDADKYEGYNPYPHKAPCKEDLPEVSFHAPFLDMDPPLPDFTHMKDCIPDLPNISFAIELPNLPILPKLAIPGMAFTFLKIPEVPLPDIPALPNFDFKLKIPDIPSLELWDAGDIDITPIEWPGFSNIPDCMKKKNENGGNE